MSLGGEKMMEKMYTIEEVAEILKVTPRTIMNFLTSGKLKSFKPSKKITRITDEHLKEFVGKFQRGGE